MRARKVLVLSYGWLSRGMPDPEGKRLELLREFLATQADANECALFWDYASLPQNPRTEKEDAIFYAALKRMGCLYASTTSKGASAGNVAGVRNASVAGRGAGAGNVETIETTRPFALVTLS